MEINSQTTGSLATLMNLIKANIGAGLLTIPFAIKHSGIVLGPLLLLLIAVTTLHCMHLLVESSRYFCRLEGISELAYSRVFELSILYSPSKWLQKQASKGGIFVTALIFITQSGCMSIYYIFIAQNARQVLLMYYDHVPEDRMIIAILLIVFVLFSFIRQLEFLAWFSVVANIAMVVSISFIFAYLIPTIPPFSPEFRPYITNFEDISLFFGLAIFTFEGIATILPFESKMKTPEHFTWVINTAIFVVLSLYVSTGVIGYLHYGDEVCGTLTLNLQPLDNVWTKSIKLLYSFAIFVNGLLQFYVMMQLTTSWIQNSKRPRIYDAFTRIFLIGLTGACAIAVPNMADYFALVGAFAASFLSLILPPVIHLLAFYQPKDDANEPLMRKVSKQSLSKLTIMKDVLLIILGLFGFVSGTIVSLQNLIKDIFEEDRTGICYGGADASNATVEKMFNHITDMPQINASNYV